MRAHALPFLMLVFLGSAASADLSGSGVIFHGPHTAETGDTVTLAFTVYNGSHDGALIDEIRFAFHPCTGVRAGDYDDSGAGNPWHYELDLSVPALGRWWHPGGDLGTLMTPGDGGPFWLTLHLDEECPCGLLPVGWTLTGILGDEPNTLGGSYTLEVDCPTAAAGAGWGTVKSAY